MTFTNCLVNNYFMRRNERLMQLIWTTSDTEMVSSNTCNVHRIICGVCHQIWCGRSNETDFYCYYCDSIGCLTHWKLALWISYKCTVNRCVASTLLILCYALLCYAMQCGAVLRYFIGDSRHQLTNCCFYCSSSSIAQFKNKPAALLSNREKTGLFSFVASKVTSI